MLRVGPSARYPALVVNFPRCNFAIVAILTITTTALTAYLINVIVQTQIKGSRNITAHHHATRLPLSELYSKPETTSFRQQQADHGKQERHQSDDDKLKPMPSPSILDLDTVVVGKLSYDDQRLWNNTLGSPKDWHPDVEASEAVETKVRPDYDLTSGFMSFKQRLAAMSKKDLLALLKILQERIEKAAILVRKRNVELNQQKKQQQQQNNDNNQKFVFKDNGVVIRSEKMDRLMGYLEKIETNAPKIDQQKLEKLSALNNGKSPIKIIKPSVMDAILKPESLQAAIKPYLREPVESVAPDEGWGPAQPQPEAEDWPAPTTAKPKKRKKKTKRPAQSTTTTPPPPPPPSTQAPVPLEPHNTIPASPAPPTATEEVWIEEEEDIFRPPPRRKTKKYKKKILPPSEAPSTTTTQAPTTTTTTSTTTTTTTTTPAPTTTTQAPTTPPEVIEDWPQDHWDKKQQQQQQPQQQQQQQPSTPAPWPEGQEEEQGGNKWPEEEWLNFVRNHVQDQLNIIYV